MSNQEGTCLCSLSLPFGRTMSSSLCSWDVGGVGGDCSFSGMWDFKVYATDFRPGSIPGQPPGEKRVWADLYLNTTALIYRNLLFFSLHPPAPWTAARVPAAPPAPAAAAAPPGAETGPVLSCSLSRSLLFTFNIKVLHLFCFSFPSLEQYLLEVMSAASFPVYCVCFNFLYRIRVFSVVIQSMFAFEIQLTVGHGHVSDRILSRRLQQRKICSLLILGSVI